MSTENLTPNAVGTYNNWTKVGGGGFQNYLAIDDPVGSPDDDTSYVKAAISDSGIKDSYNLSARVNIGSGATINSVTVKIRARHDAGSLTYQIKPMLRLGTTNNIGTSITLGTSYANHSQVISKPGGGSWSATDLDDLQVGMESVQGNALFAYHRVTQVYVEVDYTAADTVIEPSPVSLITNRVNPTVIEALIVAPTARSLVTGKVDPTVVFGSVSVVPSPAALVCAQVNPTVVFGSTTVMPAALSLVTGRNNPAVTKSDWQDFGYIFRREITFPVGHGGLTTDDVVDFTVETGQRERIATNGDFNEAIQESGYMHCHRNGLTHVVYLGTMESDGKLSIYVVTKNHGTGQWSTPVKIADAHTASDTHKFPTICVDNDGYLHVFYGCHTSSIWYAKSTNANDSSAWTLKSPFGSGNTYVIPFVIPSDGRICIICRGNTDKKVALYYSDNGGTSWTGPKQIIDYTEAGAYRVYPFGCRLDANERIHLAWSFIKSGNYTEGVWYAYSDYTGSGDGFVTWKKIDGTTCATIDSDPINVKADAGSIIVNESDDKFLYFCRHLVLTDDNKPIVYWTEFDYFQGANSSVGFGCSHYDSGWVHYRFHEELDIKMRVGRCGVPGIADRDGAIHNFTTIESISHLHHKPKADGYHTNVTRSAGSDNYALVDDGRYKHDSDGTYLYHTGACQASFTSNETIPDHFKILGAGVEIAGREVVGTLVMRVFVRINGVDYEQAVDTFTIGTRYSFRSHIWYTNPATSLPWTKSEIESLEFGFKQLSAAKEMRITNCVRLVEVTINSDDEYGSSEIVELVSDDGGATFSKNYVTGNSGIGVPILNVSHNLVTQSIELVWTSGHDVFYLSRSKFGKMRRDGRDIRIYHGAAEIDRLIDYPDFQTSKITFNLQESIASGQIRGATKLWLVYGAANVTGWPKSDPHEVFPWGYEGFESFDDDENINGQNGWTVVSGTILAYQSPPNGSNKLYEGRVTAETDAAATATKDQALARSDIYVTGALWCESGGTRIYIALKNAVGDYDAVGVHLSNDVAEYRNNGVWHDSTEPADQQNMVEVAIALENGSTISAWINGVKIANSVTADIANCTKIEFVTPSRSYVDGITTRKRLLNDVVELLTEENRGVYVGANIKGQGQDEVQVGACIIGDISLAVLVTSTIDPTIIFGSTTSTPTPVTLVTSKVDPTVALGSVAVTPSAITLVTGNVDPAVILGSITATPSPATAVTNKVDPTILLGSITITPTPATLVTGKVDPTTILGSITTTPQAAALVTSRVDPDVILPSMTVTPAELSLVTGKAEPTVVLGSLTITAPARSLVAGGNDPSVVLTSITYTPAAISLVTGRMNPTTILGSITLTPATLMLITSRNNPTVVLGDTTVTPSAGSLITGRSNPTVILGSIAVTPNASTLVTATVDATVVFGSVLITPGALSLLTSGVDPTTIKGSLILSPTARSLITGAVDPTVIKGSITLTPTAGSLVTANVLPAVILTSMTVTPIALALIASTVNPTFVAGSIVLTPSSASLLASSIDPSLYWSSTTATPTPVSTILESKNPSVLAGDIVIVPASVYLFTDGIDGTVILGATLAEPAASSLITASIDPIVVLGSIDLTPATTELVATGADPAVILGAITLTPSPASLRVTGVDPAYIAGSLLLIPTAQFLIAAAVEPVVILPSMTVIPAASSLVATGADPTFSSGDITVIPSPASCVTSGADPSSILGDITVQPAPASLVTTGVDCTTVQGSITIVPAARSLVTSTVNPDVLEGDVVVSPAPVTVLTAGIDPTVEYGSTMVTPAELSLVASAVDPIVVYGDIVLSVFPATLIVTSVAPTVLIEGGPITVVPPPVELICISVDPDIVLASMTVTPSAADLITATENPFVLTGGIVVVPSEATLVCVTVDPIVIIPVIAIRILNATVRTPQVQCTSLRQTQVACTDLRQTQIKFNVRGV